MIDKFCTYCGKTIKRQDYYCSKCGAAVLQPTSTIHFPRYQTTVLSSEVRIKSFETWDSFKAFTEIQGIKFSVNRDVVVFHNLTEIPVYLRQIWIAKFPYKTISESELLVSDFYLEENSQKKLTLLSADQIGLYSKEQRKLRAIDQVTNILEDIKARVSISKICSITIVITDNLEEVCGLLKHLKFKIDPIDEKSSTIRVSWGKLSEDKGYRIIGEE